MNRSFWSGVWRVADPKITLASAASLLLGLAAAWRDGPLHWGWLAATVLGIFCIEAAKNASGELFDFDSGTDQAVSEADRSPFSGGKRVLVDGLMSRGQVAVVAAVFYALGAGAGLAITVAREPLVLGLGIAGVALAFFYHAPPLKLSYRGWGELAVAVSYGPLISAGAYLVQRHSVSGELLLLSGPLAVLIAAFLWINEFPDYQADRGAGKRTLVVRMGRPRASGVFAAAAAAAYLWTLLLPAAGLPWTVLLGFIGAPHAVAAARRLRRHPEETPEIIPAQAWTLLSFVLWSVGTSAGLIIDRLV